MNKLNLHLHRLNFKYYLVILIFCFISQLINCPSVSILNTIVTATSSGHHELRFIFWVTPFANKTRSLTVDFMDKLEEKVVEVWLGIDGYHKPFEVIVSLSKHDGFFVNQFNLVWFRLDGEVLPLLNHHLLFQSLLLITYLN